ncbi:MAG: thiamine phosphate synthase [Dehalococcoidia bacterium]
MSLPLSLPCLALVTDRRLCQDRPLEKKVSLAVEGGVELVQLREKDLPGGTLLELAHRVNEAVGDQALFFVNERVDVALACDADGVQLGEEALPPRTVQQLAGERLLIGRSVHSVEGAVRAQAEGADLLLVGTIFPSGSHRDAPVAGVELLQQVARQVTIPVLAIGGVQENNVAEVIRAGAGGAAVIRAILAAGDPRQAAKRLSEALARAWEAQPVNRGGRG